MASYPLELAQDAAYQSHASHLTELWSLPRSAQGLNTNNKNPVSKPFDHAWSEVLEAKTLYCT